MPGFDGTGPNGAGPLTGGERGPCNSARSTTSRVRPFQSLIGWAAPRATTGVRPRWGLRLGGRGRGGRGGRGRRW